MQPPPTRYAVRDGVSIAYQVVGSGPDLVFCPGFISHLDLLGVELRAGVHTGEVELMGDDVGGMAVHIGARVGAMAGPGEILVSSTVRDLVVGSPLQFAERGEHELRGVPGRWRIYAVGEARAPAAEPLDAAADHMRAGDRLAVGLARRAPRMMRLGARVVTRS